MLGFGNKKREQAVQDEKAFVSGELVKFGGFNGNRLLTAIVFTATVGFSLFGYDQGMSCRKWMITSCTNSDSQV